MSERRPSLALPALILVGTTVTTAAVVAAQAGFDLGGGTAEHRTIEIVAPGPTHAPTGTGMLEP
jgi:hypothetical protein